ncbi:MAG: hypothetical protein QOE19_3846 [Actinomycetota bacterium]|nr:hypothetical protein [Actinomycetota bacterium]
MTALSAAALVAVLAPGPPDDAPSAPRATDPYRATRDLRPVAGWDALFARSWARQRPAAEVRSRSRDSWDHYSLAYSVDGLTAAYLATGTTAYVDESLRLVENVAGTAVRSSSLRRSQFHDDFEGWASQRPDVRGQEVPLFESYFWRYATSLLRVVRQTPALYADPARRIRYEHLLRFAEQHVMAKWLARGAEQNIYRSRTHMAAHWALIALNLSAVTTDARKRSAYRSIVARIDGDLPNSPSALHDQLVRRGDHPQAWFWSDVWGSAHPPGQDVAHGNGVLAYVVEAHDHGDHGSGWTDQDIAGFVRVFNDVIWPREGEAAQYVDGTGRGNGWFSDGFVKLGRYAPGLQRRLEAHQPANAQFYANGALNAALLTCDRAGGSSAPACAQPVPPLQLAADGT